MLRFVAFVIDRFIFIFYFCYSVGGRLLLNTSLVISVKKHSAPKLIKPLPCAFNNAGCVKGAVQRGVCLLRVHVHE